MATATVSISKIPLSVAMSVPGLVTVKLLKTTLRFLLIVASASKGKVIVLSAASPSFQISVPLSG